MKLKNVYPVYDVGWKERFERFYSQLDVVENLYMVGRTALFLHCNIDHCMSMALALARHLSEGPGLKADWNRIRSAFADYRVRE
jgi:UDP-galactopyranose mutase